MSWFWKGDLRFKDGVKTAWTQYSAADTKKIESAYQKKTVILKLNKKYNVDLKKMFQYRESDSDRQRPIKRVEPSVVWEWKSDLRLKDSNKAAWTPYSTADSQMFEEEYENDSKAVFDYGKKYQVDFGKMLQYRNDDEDRQRPIKRVETVPNPDDSDEEEPPKKKSKTSPKKK
mmetsp:Transcript_5729/g.10922  ORF Transcript_5729/g.10922 Transcript_5729/m.10922 type:complete len:173 (+) Transcript_5729:43-561(+)